MDKYDFWMEAQEQDQLVSQQRHAELDHRYSQVVVEVTGLKSQVESASQQLESVRADNTTLFGEANRWAKHATNTKCDLDNLKPEQQRDRATVDDHLRDRDAKVATLIPNSEALTTTLQGVRDQVAREQTRIRTLERTN